MARMRMTAIGAAYRLSVSGHLTGRDLRRLEQLCGPALESPRAPLTVRLCGSVSMDPSAQAYVDRLLERGALLERT